MRRNHKSIHLLSRVFFLSFVIYLSILSNRTIAQEDTRHYIPPMYSRIQPGIHYLFLSTSRTDSFNVRMFTGNSLFNDTVFISRDKPKYIELGQRYDAIGMIDATQLNKPLTKEGLFLCGNYPFQARIIHEAREEPYDYGDDDTSGYLIDQLFYILDSAQISFNRKKEVEDSIKFNDLKNGKFAGRGSMTSKGTSILGTEFRVGSYFTSVGKSPLDGHESILTVKNDTITRTINSTADNQVERISQFISIMATEDSTLLAINEIPEWVKFHKSPYSKYKNKSKPIKKWLNRGQSYVVAIYPDQVDTYDQEKNNFLVGTKVTSTKPIAVSSGTFFADNRAGEFGFDQILPLDKIGKNYIIRESGGNEYQERAVVVATEDKTKIYINGKKILGKKLNKGEFRDFNIFNIQTGFMEIQSNNNIYVYLSTTELYTDHFNSISPARECDFQNRISASYLDLSLDTSIYNEEVIDTSISDNFKSELYLYALKGTKVDIYKSENDSLISSVLFEPEKRKEYNWSILSRRVKIPKKIKHLYIEGDGSFTSGLYNSFSTTPYHSGFSSSVKINIDSDSCSCKGIELCPYDSIPLYVENSDYLEDIKWYKNDTLLTTNQYTFYAKGPGKYKLSGINNCTLCPDEFKESLDKLTISLSNDCIYPEIFIEDTLETTEKIAQNFTNLNLDIVDSSLFIPIEFRFGSSELQVEDFLILKKIADYMKTDSTFSVKLIAHTDCRGDQNYNLPLSKKRAKSVYNYLVSENIKPSRLSYTGVGESQPFNSCDCYQCTEEELAKNRRVEFIIEEK